MGLSSHILEWGKQTTVLIKFFFFFFVYIHVQVMKKVHSSLKADSTGATLHMALLREHQRTHSEYQITQHFTGLQASASEL